MNSLWQIFDSANLGAFFAQISQGLAWVAFAAGVVALVLFLRRYLPELLGENPDRYRPPDALFGLAVTPESLPDDVAGTAARLAREGKLREALSLLYRGALSVLVHRDHVPLAEGDTEGDCLRAARRALPTAGADYFGRLVRAWQGAAYAGLPVRYRALLPEGILKEMFKGGTPEAVEAFMAEHRDAGRPV